MQLHVQLTSAALLRHASLLPAAIGRPVAYCLQRSPPRDSSALLPIRPPAIRATSWATGDLKTGDLLERRLWHFALRTFALARIPPSSHVASPSRILHHIWESGTIWPLAVATCPCPLFYSFPLLLASSRILALARFCTYFHLAPSSCFFFSSLALVQTDYITRLSPKLNVSPLPDICFIYSPSNAALISEFSLIFFRQFPTPPLRTFPAYTPDDFFMLLIDDASTVLAMISGVLPQPMKAATLAMAAAGSSIMSSYLRNKMFGS